MTARYLHPRPRSFGRREPFTFDMAIAERPSVGSDIKLFAATWLAGFLTVSIFLA